MGPSVEKGNGRRKPVLDLASLELDCMNVLWPLGEATVRDIREALAGHRPRAYTTIMTIMDRLAQKGVVSRRKQGRAYLYTPNFSAREARSFAVEQLIENFFAGSAAALQAHLSGSEAAEAWPGTPAPRKPEPSRAPRPRSRPVEAAVEDSSPAAPLDETLL